MARIGGRNAFFAWFVGLACLAILGVLAYLAVPMLPVSLAWVGATVGQTSETSAPVAAGDEAVAGPPTQCPKLYDEALWAAMRSTKKSVMTPSKDAPTTTATALVSALQPQVTLTCSWHSSLGTVTTTLATVPPDAGAIASSALPAAGFTCEKIDDRTRCARSDGDLTETIEAGGGTWLSTSESGWHPKDYVSRTAAVVWP